MKALALTVYYNPKYRACANGGASETAEEIYIPCSTGIWDVEDNDPTLYKLVAIGPHVHLEPANGSPDPSKTIGPMFSGNFAHSSDSRFTEAVRAMLPHGEFYGAVPIHDRYETPAQYDLLSR